MGDFRYIHTGEIQRVSDGATLGELDTAEVLASGVEIAAYEPPPPPPIVVTLRQAREALRDFGLLATVNATINALPEEDPLYCAWHYATGISSDDELVAQMAAALDLDAAQVAALFALALTKPA